MLWAEKPLLLWLFVSNFLKLSFKFSDLYSISKISIFLYFTNDNVLDQMFLKSSAAEDIRIWYKLIILHVCHFYIIQHWVKMCIFMYAWNYFKLMNHLGTMSTQWTCIFVNLYGIEVSHLRLDSLFNPSINFYNQCLGLLPHSLVTIFQKFGQFGDKRFNRHDFISKIPIRKQNFLYVLMDTD